MERFMSQECVIVIKTCYQSQKVITELDWVFRPLDLTILDFFSMEVFKVEICENKSITINKLRDNIPQEIERTAQGICENIMENVNEKNIFDFDIILCT